MPQDLTRPRLLFATSPLRPQLSLAPGPKIPVDQRYAAPFDLESDLTTFLDELNRRFRFQAGEFVHPLSHELQVLVRTSYRYPELVGGLVVGVTDDQASIRRVFDAVVDKKQGEENARYFEDLPRDDRVAVDEVVRQVISEFGGGGDATGAGAAAGGGDGAAGAAGDALGADAALMAARVVRAPHWYLPSCSDDAGSGQEALIVLAFSGPTPFAPARDITDPLRWPAIFEGAWRSVELVSPWQPAPAAPNRTARTATVVERVNLPTPFNQPVLLRVTRLTYLPPGLGRVTERSLVYTLAAPFRPLTIDAGIIHQTVLGQHDHPPQDPRDPGEWLGLMLKQLSFRNAADASLSQLVCGQWSRLLRNAMDLGEQT